MGTDNLLETLKQFQEQKTRYLIFNKESGVLCGEILTDDPSKIDPVFYKWKEVEYDIATQVWDGGTYDKGKIIDMAEDVVEISEAEINRQVSIVISEVYPLVKQVNIMSSVLKKLIDSTGITGDEVSAFNEMCDYIDARLEANQKYKKAYSESDSFKYVTTEEDWELYAKQVAGGVHEVLGPKSGIISQPDNNPHTA